MAHIFISYSSDDKEYVDRLAEVIEKEGLSVWLDDRLKHGSAWPRVLQERVDECGALIVVMTPRSYDSNWVQDELTYARSEGKPIFNLLLEGKPWLTGHASHYVDVRDGSLPPTSFYREISRVIGPAKTETASAPTPITARFMGAYYSSTLT